MSDPSKAGGPGDLELFREYAATRSRAIRNELVERNIGLAIHIARRMRRPSVSTDDLEQVAMLGLVKAVERFDPAHGAPFSSFAGTTIEGELKRHFRDRTWSVRIPRSAKDLHLAVNRAIDDLTARLGRSPTVDELAAHLGIDRADVLRGMAASAAARTDSLDGRTSDGGRRPESTFATDEHGYGVVEDVAVVDELLAQLPERQREIVRLRFYEDMSQSEIAEAIGLSQMHVSRLLRQSFSQLRELSKGSI